MSNEFEAYKIYVQSARKSLFKTKNSNFNAQNNSKKDKNDETLDQKGATQ